MLHALDEREAVLKTEEFHQDTRLSSSEKNMVGIGALLLKIDPTGWYSRSSTAKP
jgi:hypothetical protein